MARFRVKEFVARIGCTQKELAVKVGVKKDAVYKWSVGASAPTYDVIYKLKKMGATDYDLFGESFAEQAELFRKRATRSTLRFLEELGIDTKSIKETL